MVCDRCGMIDEDGFNDFHLEHVFGYGTGLDQTKVLASICDACLAEILAVNVPGAQFLRHDDGGERVVPPEEILATLDPERDPRKNRN